MEKQILPNEIAQLSWGANFYHAWKQSIFQNNIIIVYLCGDLGCGKTTFVRGFLREAGIVGSIKSPTYNLVETYTLPESLILHFDLYRFNDPNEWEEAGFNDLLKKPCITFIEWPQNGINFIPHSDLILDFEMKHDYRTCQINSCSDIGNEIIQIWQTLREDKY